jgi:arsenate reductase-like glutaredoxin family protein
LLNKRGTTWRKLSEEQQDACNETTVCVLLSEQPSMIKRPLLVIQRQQDGQQIQAFVGFKAGQYATIFKL